MKKFFLILVFSLLSTFVFSQRRELHPSQPREIILFKTFSKSDLKRLGYNKIKLKKHYPYLEIFLNSNGTKDSTIYGYSKPLIDTQYYRKGYIPVYSNF